MKKITQLAKILLMVICLSILITGCHNSLNDPPAETKTPVPEDGDELQFTLLQTTDVHHRASGTGASRTFTPVDGNDGSGDTDKTLGGYSRLATRIAGIRMANAVKEQPVPTVLIDSGDFLMGTVYDMTLGESPAALAFIESMHYDAVTVGNHEFDYGPAALALFINNALGDDNKGLTVPILATNMVTDNTAGTDDDGLESLIQAGVIQSVYTKTLENGLKIGFIGLLGEDAENDAPLATPVQFKNKLSGYVEGTDDAADATVVADLQQVVTTLRETVDVVIALSHSGVSDIVTPAGDDIDLAGAVTGIDIIASGHEHRKTTDVIEVDNGTHVTYIVCAGYYGKNLAQLDVSYTKGSGISGVALTNHTIDDSVAGNKPTQFMVDLFDAAINQGLETEGLSMNSIVGTTDSDNLDKPQGAEESGMGNLIADSLRYTLSPFVEAGVITTPTIGVVANGVIRNSFEQDQLISFADLYSVLPLGMSLDITQQNIPGYPLVTVYLSGAHVKNMCQLVSYTMAAQDGDFRAALPTRQAYYEGVASQLTDLATGLNAGGPTDIYTYNTFVLPAAGSGEPADTAIAYFNQVKSGGGTDTEACQAAAQVYSAAASQATQAAALCAGLPYVLPALDPEYFMNISGVQFTHDGGDAMGDLYQITAIGMYGNADTSCSGATVPLEDETLYPCVVDIYAGLIMMDTTFQTMLNQLGIPVTPLDAAGTSIVQGTVDGTGTVTKTEDDEALEITKLLAARVDSDGISANGIQEVKEWQAFLNFVVNMDKNDSLIPEISDTDYGNTALSAGDSSRMNP